MDCIRMNDALPAVFQHRAQVASEVWGQQVCLEKGKTYLVRANSGTGKSSMCSFIIGYRNDYLGEIRFDDRDIRTLNEIEWVEVRQRSISHMFQELRLFPELTAMENVMIKNQLTGFKSRNEVVGWFEAFGLADKVDTKIGQMSFGQQQRVALMRALVQPFDFILLDEPISHLDETNSRIMSQILMVEARKQGAGVVVTSIGSHMDLDYDKELKL